MTAIKRVVFVEPKYCALTGEEFIPRVPWQKYAKPGSRQKAHRATLATLRKHLAEMAERVKEKERMAGDFAEAVVRLQKQVRGMGAVPVA